MTGSRKTSILALVILIGACGALWAAPSAQWSGTVAAVSGDDLALVGVADRFRLAGGATELLTGRTVPARDLAPGSSVTLRVGPREADGRFRVDQLIVQPKSPMSLSGGIDSVSADRRLMVVHGVRIELDDRTAFSGRAGAHIARSARDLRPGLSARVDLTASASGELRATAVRIQNANGERNEDREFKGTVSAIAETSWTIDDRSFAITDATLFEGDPQVGDFVEVKFHLDADGNEVANRIEKEDDRDEDLEFVGIVEAIGASSWTISGRVVVVDVSTQIEGSPTVGDTVEVHAVELADGSLKATRIHEEDRDRDENPGDDDGDHGGPDDTGDHSGHQDGDHSGSNSGPGSGNSGPGGGNHKFDDGDDD